MSFVQREIDRIAEQLGKEEYKSPKWELLYVARTALAWALEPAAIMNPFTYITGQPGDARSDGDGLLPISNDLGGGTP